jgi:hypothetical protein
MFPTIHDYMKRLFGWSQGDCDKYLNPAAPAPLPKVAALNEEGRKAYELQGGTPLTQGSSPEPFDTSGMFSKHMGAGYSIYVMDKEGRLYAAQHKVGLFHHSTFLAGGVVAGAGEVKVEHGTVKTITNKSGHYLPTAAEMVQVLEELKDRGINLASVEYIPMGGTTGTAKDMAQKQPYPGGAAQFVEDQKAASGPPQA